MNGRYAGATRKVLLIAGTELRRLLRDRTNVFFFLLFPLLLVLVLGVTFGGGSQPGLGVVGPAEDRLAAEAMAALEQDEEVDVFYYDSEGALRGAVERGSVQAGVILPDGYSAQLDAGGTVDVGFIAQPTGLGAQLRPVVEAAVGPQSTRFQAARFGDEHTALGFDAALQQATELEPGLPAVTVRTTNVGDELFPSSLGQFDVGASTQLVLFVFVNALAASAVLIENRRLGVTRRMLSTPTSPRVVLVGEAFGRLAVALAQGAYIMLGTWWLFGVSWGDPLGAVTLLLAFALVATGAAMLAGAVFSHEQQAASIGVFLGLGLAALGGSMAPLEVFSPTMRDVAHITPHAWANEGFAELVQDGGDLVDIMPQLGVLTAMATVLIGVAAWRLRRSITAT